MARGLRTSSVKPAVITKDVEKAAKAVDGLWVGVDIFPSKDRNKIPPTFIEINSTPGTRGYRKATGENLPKDVLEKFMNRELWLKPATYKSMFSDE